jgi:hypothetical protein
VVDIRLEYKGDLEILVNLPKLPTILIENLRFEGTVSLSL